MLYLGLPASLGIFISKLLLGYVKPAPQKWWLYAMSFCLFVCHLQHVVLLVAGGGAGGRRAGLSHWPFWLH